MSSKDPRGPMPRAEAKSEPVLFSECTAARIACQRSARRLIELSSVSLLVNEGVGPPKIRLTKTGAGTSASTVPFKSPSASTPSINAINRPTSAAA